MAVSPGTCDHSLEPTVLRQELPTAFFATIMDIRRGSCKKSGRVGHGEEEFDIACRSKINSRIHMLESNTLETIRGLDTKDDPWYSSGNGLNIGLVVQRWRSDNQTHTYEKQSTRERHKPLPRFGFPKLHAAGIL